MAKYKTLMVGKSRLIRRGKMETWIKADLVIEFEDEGLAICASTVKEAINDIELTLEMEARREYERWDALTGKSGEQQDRGCS